VFIATCFSIANDNEAPESWLEWVGWRKFIFGLHGASCCERLLRHIMRLPCCAAPAAALRLPFCAAPSAVLRVCAWHHA
jgi:hypothetical protein